MTTSSDCRVCGNAAGNTTHLALEMMFGTREEFAYVECASCGTVQLSDPPVDMARHYPDDYYAGDSVEAIASGRVRSVKRIRTEIALRAPKRLAQVPKLHPGSRPMWFHGHATTRSRIVDLGCGAGHNLRALWNAGFSDLAGYDPFFDGDADAPFTVHRVVPEWFAGHFDVAMMHHAFEHVPRPAEQLAMLKSLLRPGGKILLRVPLADSWAWRHYGTNWVQLDPPRHFWLLTDTAMDLLAEQAGLRVVERWRDSTAFQMWGSELYAAGHPLHGAQAPVGRTSDMEEQARLLNQRGDGDQGAFWLAARDA